MADGGWRRFCHPPSAICHPFMIRMRLAYHVVESKGPMKPPERITLSPGKRVLFLTKDPDLIRRQLAGELDLRMEDLKAEDLLDDINTDAMTPAWVCFDYKPEDIARNAYAGLIVNGERLFPADALRSGNFEVIVSGYRKGVGSSRETATQCELYSGIRIAVAASFAPIHAGNNINQGLLMASHEMLVRLQRGEGVPLSEFYEEYDPITRLIIQSGGLFPFSKAVARGEIELPVPHNAPRPMTMGEKILARHMRGVSDEERYVKPGDAVVVDVDGGYTHEFTTAQVHYFLEQEYGPGYEIANPQKFAVFEDHLIYADDVARMRPFMDKIETLREMQRAFQRHSGCRDFSAVSIAGDNISPGICHEVAREYIVDPGDFIQATDSHTCMGGVNNALAWGVGTTEYANLVHAGFTTVEVSESIRFELTGTLRENVTAKDVMLHILLEYAKPQLTLDRIMEFTGPGLRSLSMDERATLAGIGAVKIDIAYAGSCTAGKVDDFLFYHQVAKEAVDAGLRVADGVKFFVQFGSHAVEQFARDNGLLDTFERAGAIVLNPGCGACIGCGPGVSETGEQVTVSAINRNYKGRSGPGKLWLASPLTVAASAFTGSITAYKPGMFAKKTAVGVTSS